MTPWNTPSRWEPFAYVAGLAMMATALVIFAAPVAIVLMGVVGLCLGVVVGVRSGIRAVVAGRWTRARTWLSLSVGCISTGMAGFSVAYVTGLFSGGLDVRETCVLRRGVVYDHAYVEAHASEFQQWFPLHSKCNAHVDLVPSWVNPTAVFFALLAAIGVLCLAAAAVTALRGRSR